MEERVQDLAEKMSMEQIAGLMLDSSHQTVTAPDSGDTFNERFAETYDGKPFDPETAKEFGQVMAKEYRGLGITTALSPQIDLASEPRWNRYNGTFEEGTKLSTDMARAYVDGCQTTEGSTDGWGEYSVNAMVKHWPGGGTGEGGRDAHFSYGKYAVYPGDNFGEHLKPFTEGAFQLEGKTKEASAVMPYYTISYDIDKKYGENVGNSDNISMMGGTDWEITATCDSDHMICGMNWGVAHLSVEERHYKALMAGIDQFGGNNDKEPVMAAYRLIPRRARIR